MYRYLNTIGLGIYWYALQTNPAHLLLRSSLIDVDISWSAMLLALPEPVAVVDGEVLTCRSHATWLLSHTINLITMPRFQYFSIVFTYLHRDQLWCFCSPKGCTNVNSIQTQVQPDTADGPLLHMEMPWGDNNHQLLSWGSTSSARMKMTYL